MSRTYRRSKSVVPEWVKRESTLIRLDGLNHCDFKQLQGMDLMSAIAKFHSDATSDAIPSDFKTTDKGIKRARDKVALDKINKDGCYEDYSFNPHKRDYQYNYW